MLNNNSLEIIHVHYILCILNLTNVFMNYQKVRFIKYSFQLPHRHQ